ncbi:MAG: hypothetical protein ACYSUK_11825 [Planctomycetota bacterium]|jgi:hypothetical protein
MAKKTVILSIIFISTLFTTYLSAGTYSGGTGEPNNPFQITNPNDWTASSAQVADISSFGYSGKEKGGLVSWGDRKLPESDLDSGIVAIAAGYDHSLALKSDGSIVGWGKDHYGQATPPAGTDYVAIAAGYVAISAGGYHSLALRSDGSIVGWGYDYHGQATPPAGTDYVGIATGSLHSLALKSDGSIVGWGDDYHGRATPPTGTDYVAIAAGIYHNLALKSIGSIVGWGSDYYGQATPPAGTDYVAIAPGRNHSLALKSDGSIVGWGSDYYGQATPPAGTDFVAIAAGGFHSLALRSDGSIIGWGLDDYGQAIPPAGTDYIAIAAGDYYSLAIRNKPPVAVAVDIRSGNCPNPMNVKSSGVLPVAILGSEDINILEIYPASIRLEGVAPIHSNYEDIATPVSDPCDCNCITDGPDGYLDMTLKFDTQEIVETMCEANDGDILPLLLTGKLFDGTPIEGIDCVHIKGKHFKKADINEDGVIDFLDYGFFANHYGLTDCNDINDCNSTDLNFSGAVDNNDLDIFSSSWKELFF